MIEECAFLRNTLTCTPSSSQAQVQAYVVGIAPEVAGRVIEVNVTDNAAVEPGQILFRIDPARYEIAVAEAEAALSMSTSNMNMQDVQKEDILIQLLRRQTTNKTTTTNEG